MTESEFYLRDLQFVDIRGKVVEQPGVLFFKMSRPATTRDPNMPPHSFEGNATRDHVAQYRDAYKRFRKANLDYRCPWPELEVEVAAPVVEEAKEVDVPAEAVVEEAPAPADEPVAE